MIEIIGYCVEKIAEHGRRNHGRAAYQIFINNCRWARLNISAKRSASNKQAQPTIL
jgi:hypothetical protein